MESENKPGDKKNKSNLSASSILKITLRILLVLLSGGIIGAIVYFSAAGWVPYLEQRLFEPAENNQDQILELAATQHSLENQISFLIEEMHENQALNYQDLDSAFAVAEGKIEELQAIIETMTAHNYTQVPAQMATLVSRQQANSNHISALATAQINYLVNGFDTELLKIIALLSRANQFTLHANYGLAEEQLISARQILLDIDEELDSWQRIQALEMTSAIEGAIKDLPDQPILASGQIELAWQLALIGFNPLPDQDLEGTPSPTPFEAGTATPTPN